MATRTTDPAIEPFLEPYHFYTEEWSSYDELRAAFEWEIPAEFNMATYVCDRWAAADPDRVAGIVAHADGSETVWTYGRLQRVANQLATYLADRGIERGDRIGVSGAQRFEFLASHIAAWKLGAITIPLSILYGPDGLRYRLADSGARAFVADGAILDAFAEIRDDLDAMETVLAVGAEPTGDDVAFEAAIDGQSTTRDTATTDPEETATILYTSGTTGQPKGVVHPHRTLLGILPGFVTSGLNLERREDDRTYTPVEWSWAGTFYTAVLPSLYYGSEVLGDADPAYDPERMLAMIDRYDVTGIGGPATVYRMLMAVDDVAERYDLSSLRVVIQGGEALGQSIVDWIRETVDDVAVHEVYGQTEAPVFLGDCEALGVGHRPGRMGRPIPGHEVAILGDDASQLGPGETGELALRYGENPLCFGGFWNMPSETDARIREGWLLTEDLAERDEHGHFAFHSRTDDVIISSGYRIGPTEIEECLAGHEAVANAGVIGVPDAVRGEIPKAFVTLTPGTEPGDELRETLQAYVKDRLAKHEYPRAVEFVEDLPMTSTAKLRRRDLRAREGLDD